MCEAVCTCGTLSFRVRYRRPDEDIAEWLEKVVGPAMGKAHSEMSPLCQARGADLKIPVNEGSSIGVRP